MHFWSTMLGAGDKRTSEEVWVMHLIILDLGISTDRISGDV